MYAMGNGKKFICIKCGYESLKWLGKCPSCGSWSSFVQETGKIKESEDISFKVYKPEEIDFSSISTLPFYSELLNEFFGRGLVKGSVILITGEPGIGKSTFLLELERLVAKPCKILYVSGEETEFQIAERAKRIGVKNVLILTTTNLNVLLQAVEELKPDILIVDSVQTMVVPDVEGVAGSISQVRAVAEKITEISKKSLITSFIVGHVTKTGVVAGPKLLEHVVDVVVYIEGERTSPYRFMKCLKNRFGPTGGVVVFEMQSRGLMVIENPSQFFIEQRPVNLSGSVISSILEGNRAFLIEVQALTTAALYPGGARRMVSMYDVKRLNILLAIMEKRLSMNLSAVDVYVNIPGGIVAKDPALDLAVIVAVYSSFVDKAVPPDVLIFGEVGLGGEVRAVKDAEIRLKEAISLGFKKFLIPKGNRINIVKNGLIEVTEIKDAIEYLF